ncbi:MAG: hypothetical protein R3C56_35955 [Pirellulaceae bacterium]
MASLITRLLSRFKTQKRSRETVANSTVGFASSTWRRARPMAGDLGSIAGNHTTDLADDGYQVSDVGIAGVVSLFQDAPTPGSRTLGARMARPFKRT